MVEPTPRRSISEILAAASAPSTPAPAAAPANSNAAAAPNDTQFLAELETLMAKRVSGNLPAVPPIAQQTANNVRACVNQLAADVEDATKAVLQLALDINTEGQAIAANIRERGETFAQKIESTSARMQAMALMFREQRAAASAMMEAE